MKSLRSKKFRSIFLALIVLTAVTLTLNFLAHKRNVVSAQGPACGCMDVVLVVDDTGSMGGAIDNVKAGLANIISTAQTASGGDLRVGVVSFKDTTEVDQPLTTNLTDVTNAVNALTAGGGGGEPESSDEALKYVVSGASACTVDKPKGDLGAFRTGCLKITVLVTDARPAGCDDNYADGVDDTNAANVALQAASSGIRISSVLVDNGSITSAAHPAGVEPDVMANYAMTTDGVFTTVPADGTGTGAAIEGIISTCGTASLPGRMTGGGSVFTGDGVRVTHGFTLRCSTAASPNNLEVNWGGNKFHLDTLTAATCSDDPALAPNPPAAGFDTFTGKGTGSYNGVPGATAEWVFTDAGEPGRNDSATLTIKDAGNNVVLSVTGLLNKGNHQAHKQN